MTWIRLDDSAPDHKKLRRAGADACWLWVRGLAYSNRLHTDGKLDKDVFDVVVGNVWPMKKAMALAAKLCSDTVGLWYDRGDHFEIHDYEQYQGEATREEEEIRKEYEKLRKRDQRAAKRARLDALSVPESVPDKSQDSVPDNYTDRSPVVPGTVPRAPASLREHAPARVPGPSRSEPPRTDPSPDEREARSTRTDAPPEVHETPEGDSLFAAQATARSLLEREFKNRVVAKTCNPPGQSPAYQKALTSMARWLCESAQLRACSVDTVIAELLEGFFADATAVSKGFPITFLANNPTQYLPAARRAQGAVSVRGAMAPVSLVHDRGRVDVRAAIDAMEKTK
jgi:hypothetical protein